MIILFSHSSTV